MPAQGNCLPSRNSTLVTGVDWKLVIEPVSFSLHHAERGHDGGDQHQHQHDDAGHDRVHALEGLVVAEAGLDRDRVERGVAAGTAQGVVGEIGLCQPGDIAARGLGAERHGAIEPDADFGSGVRAAGPCRSRAAPRSRRSSPPSLHPVRQARRTRRSPRARRNSASPGSSPAIAGSARSGPGRRRRRANARHRRRCHSRR